MFKGTYRHKIDAKGRLPVPAAFRRALASAGAASLVVTPFDQCLAAYPPAEWRRVEAQLRALPPFARQAKALTRLLASRATDCDLDTQGRILLPLSLRASAGLAREAIVVGVLDRIEVWPPESWDAFLRESERLLDDVSFDVPWPLPGAQPETSGSAPGRPQGKPSR